MDFNLAVCLQTANLPNLIPRQYFRLFGIQFNLISLLSGEGENPAVADQSPEEGEYPPPHSPTPELAKDEGIYVAQTPDMGCVAEQVLPDETPEIRGAGTTASWDQYGGE